MIDRNNHGCERCRKRDLGVLEQLGTEMREEYFDGNAHETTKNYRCTNCGSLWNEIIESGLGGRGKHWNPASQK